MGRPSKDLESEITREKKETEHWKLSCLVLRYHNNELLMECSEVRKRYEEGFKEGREISQKHDDSNVIVYKRKRYTAILENEQRDKCQQCFKLNWEVDDLKYKKERAHDEIEGSKFECLELELHGDLVEMREGNKRKREAEQEKDRCVQLDREIEDMKLGKKREAVEIEDLKRKCMELESRVTVFLNHEIELGKELEAYKIKCQGLSAEGTGIGELTNYRTKCSGIEEHIKGLIEEGIVMSERETSAHGRIYHLEEVIKKMETNERKRVTERNSALRSLQKEISCEKTCREMGGSVDVANVAHLTRTVTSPNATFTPSCKPSSLQVNSDGVHVSDLPHVNNQCKSAEGAKAYFASAVGHQVGSQTEGISTENLVLLKQQDGARTSTTCIVEIDGEDEIVAILHRVFVTRYSLNTHLPPLTAILHRVTSCQMNP
ncbi:hypothetical protein MKX01_011435 [Papaver californicum]|nr:hypothetical protein MKX01_011435 [Papaver californicum]